LQEWVASLTNRFPSEIDFVLLFGSVARNEFVLGKSDVDLIIQTVSDESVESVNRTALELFWKLDKKWGTRFKQVCSIGKPENALDSLLKKAESHARLYKPFEVFGPRDLDWKKGTVLRPDLFWGAFWIAGQLTLFYKMKKEGKVLYGRNILAEIHPNRSFWEKFKALIVPQHLAFAGVLLALFLPKRALGYAIKSVLWELESALIVRNRFVVQRQQQSGQLEQEIAEFESFFSWKRFLQSLGIKPLKENQMCWVQECLRAKERGFSGNRFQTLVFCWHSFVWVLRVRFWVSVKELFFPRG
jgi:predicted nucleotidyltransferase